MTPVAAHDVFQFWFAHEQKTRRGVFEEHRNRYIQYELPKRAGKPKSWYRCAFDPLWASNFQPIWKKWNEWSSPEGTYFRIAQRILSDDPIIPSGDSELIRQIAVTLGKHTDWFSDDPVIIRGNSLKGPFKVIEGSHRVSAVALLEAMDHSIEPFTAFVGI